MVRVHVGLDLEDEACEPGFGRPDEPRPAIHWAKVGLLDTIGCMIAGSRDKSTQIVTRVTTGSSGPSLLFGQDRRVAALDAALARQGAAQSA